ncbi:MAG: hypothetical protein H6713_15965 [Myxococcales bacterium]|nr:hypothetical protein [Myxococcales bacterium]
MLSFAPYLVFGNGLVGQGSGTLGADIDAAINFGGGIKLHVHRRVALRVELRDSMLRRDTHHLTLNLGVSLMLLRGRQRPLADRDHDGIPDPGPGVRFPDQCPETPGFYEFDGCPPPADGGEFPIRYHGAGATLRSEFGRSRGSLASRREPVS